MKYSAGVLSATLVSVIIVVFALLYMTNTWMAQKTQTDLEKFNPNRTDNISNPRYWNRTLLKTPDEVMNKLNNILSIYQVVLATRKGGLLITEVNADCKYYKASSFHDEPEYNKLTPITLLKNFDRPGQVKLGVGSGYMKVSSAPGKCENVVVVSELNDATSFGVVPVPDGKDAAIQFKYNTGSSDGFLTIRDDGIFAGELRTGNDGYRDSKFYVFDYIYDLHNTLPAKIKPTIQQEKSVPALPPNLLTNVDEIKNHVGGSWPDRCTNPIYNKDTKDLTATCKNNENTDYTNTFNTAGCKSVWSDHQGWLRCDDNMTDLDMIKKHVAGTWHETCTNAELNLNRNRMLTATCRDSSGTEHKASLDTSDCGSVWNREGTLECAESFLPQQYSIHNPVNGVGTLDGSLGYCIDQCDLKPDCAGIVRDDAANRCTFMNAQGLRASPKVYSDDRVGNVMVRAGQTDTVGNASFREQDWYVNGNDIQTMKGSLGTCMTECEKREDCAAFARVRTVGDKDPNGDCLLKRSISTDAANTIRSHPTYKMFTKSTPGSSQNSGQYTVMRQAYEGGKIVGTPNVNGLVNCLRDCNSIPACKGFTYDMNNGVGMHSGTCVLKSEIGQGTVYHDPKKITFIKPSAAPTA